MSPEDSRRLEAIERRLEEITRRLDQLEGAPQRPRQKMPAPPPPRVQMEPPVPPRNIETTVGLTWLSRIAVVTVVLALAFFFEYAFENHWISEFGRVLLGLGCGVAALAIGERFWRTGQHSYGNSLTAAGIAFLYLSVWAAFGLYHLVSQPLAFAAMVTVTVLSGALALRYEGQAVAMLGLAGGFATPLLLGSGSAAVFVLGYALLLDAGAAFASRARHWRWLEMLAVAGTVVLYCSQPTGDKLLFTVFMLLYYTVFAASDFQPVMLTAQVLAGFALVLLWSPGLAGLALACLVAAAGLAVAWQRVWSLAVLASAAGFWLSYLAWHVEAGDASTWGGALLIVTLAFLLFVAWSLWRGPLLLIPTNAALYFGTGHGLLLPHFPGWEGLFAVAVAIIYIAAARYLWRRNPDAALLTAATAGVLLVVAAPVQFTGYQVTIAWGFEAAAVVWFGVRFSERRAVYGAMEIFLLAVLRLAAVDSPAYPDHGHVLPFLVTAGSLWAAAWWIRQGRLALVTYVCGHAVMLWGLALEVAAWAHRSADPANFRSVTSTSISVLFAGYAVLLVAAGAGWKSGITRVLGIVLIGLVVAKLYLYDVWLLGQFYRMAAFAILGVLLLVLSYVYSRFRGSIESLWRP